MLFDGILSGGKREDGVQIKVGIDRRFMVASQSTGKVLTWLWEIFLDNVEVSLGHRRQLMLR